MTTTAPEHSIRFGTAWFRRERGTGRAGGVEVAAPVDVAVADAISDGSRLGRAMVVGAVVGLVVTTAGVAVAALVNGMELASALGLGAFVGMWGGAGSGFMMGATLTLARHPEIAGAGPSVHHPPSARDGAPPR